MSQRSTRRLLAPTHAPAGAFYPEYSGGHQLGARVFLEMGPDAQLVAWGSANTAITHTG